MKKLIMKILLILLTLYTGCKDDPPVVPPPPEPKATLTLQDVSCLEAWIKLQLENIELPVNVSILKDSLTAVQINNLTSNDTIIYIDSLQPSQTYKLHSVIQSFNQSEEVKSNELTITTLTPTSQEFTWQAYSWGMHSSSEIRDIAIIDENNIWCVGEIYLNDSSGISDPHSYNAINWNGIEWELYKFQFYTFCCQPSTGSYPARSIFAFNKNEIFISSGSQIIQVYGTTQMMIECVPVSVNKIWGTDKNNIYAVGVIGKISNYQNDKWSSIETGTDINFRDIYGSINKDNNELEIIALASNSGINQRKKIIRIKDQTVETLPDSGLADYLSTIWFISGRKYCLGGQGYYCIGSAENGISG